jgi:hypothetical protein
MSLSGTTKAGIEFAAHVFIATLVLVIVGGAAVCLGYFHHWLASFPIEFVPPFVPKIVEYLEIGVYVLDIVAYCLYVLVNALGFAKGLITYGKDLWDE